MRTLRCTNKFSCDSFLFVFAVFVPNDACGTTCLNSESVNSTSSTPDSFKWNIWMPTCCMPCCGIGREGFSIPATALLVLNHQIKSFRCLCHHFFQCVVEHTIGPPSHLDGRLQGCLKIPGQKQLPLPAHRKIPTQQQCEHHADHRRTGPKGAKLVCKIWRPHAHSGTNIAHCRQNCSNQRGL